MARHSGLAVILGTTFTVWIIVMGILVHIYYFQKRDPDLDYFAPDIQFDKTSRIYYGMTREGKKIGYKSTALISNEKALVAWENSVIKLNCAGMSREVFVQCAVSLDSTRIFSQHMDFSIQSGTHFYNCKALASSDSLIIDVKNESSSPWRKGFFLIPESFTYPIALPYYCHRSVSDTLRVMVFDPLLFSLFDVTGVRGAKEVVTIENNDVETRRYDLFSHDRHTTIWLDSNGEVLKNEGDLLFSGVFGPIRTERSRNRNVLMLPLEVTAGNDLIDETAIIPDRPIEDPRSVRYMEIRLDNIRAANIDVEASNKNFISAYPVIFGIHYMPLLSKKIDSSGGTASLSDTSLVGTSDYIQSKDARFVRLARELTSAETDTLEMARKINEWVYANIAYIKNFSIARSIDIYRDRRGGVDEHTKIFTALARSIGIPTQIHLGLVYIDGAFRYHSWPSVFTDGTWNDLDPTLGQNRADATHVTLIRGDFDKLIEIHRLIGRISIAILDYR